MKSGVKVEALVFIGLVLFLRVVRNPNGRLFSLLVQREPFYDTPSAVRKRKKPQSKPEQKAPWLQKQEVNSQEVSVTIPPPENAQEQESTPYGQNNPQQNSEVHPQEVSITISVPESETNAVLESTDELTHHDQKPAQPDEISIVLPSLDSGQDTSIAKPSIENENLPDQNSLQSDQNSSQQSNEHHLQGTNILVSDDASRPGSVEQNDEAVAQNFYSSLPATDIVNPQEVSVEVPQSQNTDIQQNQEVSQSENLVKPQVINTGEVAPSYPGTPFTHNQDSPFNQNTQLETGGVVVSAPESDTQSQQNEISFDNLVNPQIINTGEIAQSNLETPFLDNQDHPQSEIAPLETTVVGVSTPESAAQPQQNNIQSQANLEIQPQVVTVRRLR
mmetsp:Transcript_13865/g.20463  ORF Transcript_13865/g.20463 Transcript_13865/m.20463 type:complete len:389 (+) Transcript_13865:17-1183(+)|eukprot:CAMPEP_0194202036 /NCGR_PEP_ID=MMETSP0156-20130528/2164_1 /TAXON_ID=33649 /ORGANISM="Thalassionema nitzschioides, Strain L26-B" /LENGTH=388 /DNA_ID=CAMNT_0038927401 /DNA_START=17 /DNA_END=1183 /DNA_ORIENTATION=-